MEQKKNKVLSYSRPDVVEAASDQWLEIRGMWELGERIVTILPALLLAWAAVRRAEALVIRAKRGGPCLPGKRGE